MAWAETAGVPAHAVTDHGCLTALYPFFLAARHTDIRPLFGMEAYFDAREGDGDSAIDRLDRTHLILIAKNLEGFRNLVRINNASWQKGFRAPRYAVAGWGMLERFHRGIICTTACVGGPVAIAVRRGRYERAEEIYRRLHEIFGSDFYPEVAAHPIPDQPAVNQAVLAYARHSARPPVLTNDCHYFKSEDWFTHNLYIKTSEKTPKTFSYSASCFFLRTPGEMRRLGFPKAYSDVTVRIAESCTAYEELRARLARGVPGIHRRTESLFPIRSVRISAKMALGDAARVMRVNPDQTKEWLSHIRSTDTLKTAHRRSRLIQALAQKHSFMWQGATGLEGLPRYVEPDFSVCVDVDEECLSYLPLRSIDGIAVVDVEAGVLRELGLRVRPARAAEQRPLRSRRMYYEGLWHWWNDEFGPAAEIFEKAICGDVPAEAYFRLSECLAALGKPSLAKNVLGAFISTSPDPSSLVTERARRKLKAFAEGVEADKKSSDAVSVDHVPDFSVLYLKRQFREEEIRHAVRQVERLLESDVGVVAVSADAACQASPFFLPLLIGVDAFLRRYRGRIYRIGPRGPGRLLNRWFPARPTFGDVSREIPRDLSLQARAAPELAFHAHAGRRTIRHSQLIRSRLRFAVLRESGGRTWRLPVTDIGGEWIRVVAPRTTALTPERARVELELGQDVAVSESALAIQSSPEGWHILAPSVWNLRPLRVGKRKLCRIAARVVSCTPGGVPDIQSAEITELSLSGCVIEGADGFSAGESVATVFGKNEIALAAWKIRSEKDKSIWAFYDYEPSIRARLARAFSLSE